MAYSRYNGLILMSSRMTWCVLVANIDRIPTVVGSKVRTEEVKAKCSSREGEQQGCCNQCCQGQWHALLSRPVLARWSTDGRQERPQPTGRGTLEVPCAVIPYWPTCMIAFQRELSHPPDTNYFIT